MWCLRLFNFVFGLVCGAGQFVWHLGGFGDLIIGFVCGQFSDLCMALGLRQATGYTSPFLFFVNGHCQLFFQLITQPLYSLLAFLQVDVRLFLVSSSFCASRVILLIFVSLPSISYSSLGGSFSLSSAAIVAHVANAFAPLEMPLPHWKNTIIQALQVEGLVVA